MEFEQNKTLGFSVVKGDTVYNLQIPTGAWPLTDGRIMAAYYVEFAAQGDRGTQRLEILAGEMALAQIHRTQGNVVAARAAYNLLGTDQTKIQLDQAAIDDLLKGKSASNKEIRSAVLEYIDRRLEELPDPPPTLIEILCSLHYDPKAVVMSLNNLQTSKRLSLGTADDPYFPASFDELLHHVEYEPAFKKLHSSVRVFPGAEEWVRREAKEYRNRSEKHTDGPGSIIDISNHYYYKLTDTSTELDGEFAFVLMPFNEDEFSQDYFHKVVQPTVKDVLDISCVRVDMDKFKNFIESKIYTHLIKSEFIIAELSTENPNVVFELGQAFAFQKEIIPTYYNKYGRKDGPKLSFDYRHYDTIFYDDYAQLESELRETLVAMKRRKEKSV